MVIKGAIGLSLSRLLFEQSLGAFPGVLRGVKDDGLIWSTGRGSMDAHKNASMHSIRPSHVLLAAASVCSSCVLQIGGVLGGASAASARMNEQKHSQRCVRFAAVVGDSRIRAFGC